jgi:hypothetical protein
MKKTNILIFVGVAMLAVIGQLFSEAEPEPAPPKPIAIYPTRQPTELEIFQSTMAANTPGIMATAELRNLNLQALKELCPSLVESSSRLGLDRAATVLADELRLNNGYGPILAGNLAVGMIDGCAAWGRGDSVNPGTITERDKRPLNHAEIRRWERTYGR